MRVLPSSYRRLAWIAFLAVGALALCLVMAEIASTGPSPDPSGEKAAAIGKTEPTGRRTLEEGGPGGALRTEAQPQAGRPRWVILDYLRDRLGESGIGERRTAAFLPPRESEHTIRSAPSDGEERATRRHAPPNLAAVKTEGGALTRYPEEAVLSVPFVAAGLVVATLALAFFATTAVRHRLDERRGQRRRKVSQPGQIAAATLPGPVSCTILDLSLGGARIGLAKKTALPPDFDLVFLQTGTTRRVEIRWENGLQFGVQFKD